MISPASSLICWTLTPPISDCSSSHLYIHSMSVHTTFPYIIISTSRHLYTFCVIVGGVFYSKASVHAFGILFESPAYHYEVFLQ